MNRAKLFIIESIARRLPPCEDICERHSDDPQRKRSLKDRLIIRLHLMTCTWCTNYGRQMEIIDDAARQATTDPEIVAGHRKLDSQFRSQLKQRLRDNNPN